MIDFSMYEILDIKDKRIINAITKTNEWYTLCTLLNQIGIFDYRLWIGTLKWGDNEENNIIARKSGEYIYFKRDNEISYDLVSMIIHSWECNEPIELHLNDAINETMQLLVNQGSYSWYEIDKIRHVSPYWFHDGKRKSV